MNSSPTARDVIEAIASWLEAKKKAEKEDAQPYEYNAFGFPTNFDYLSSRDDGDEQKALSEAEQKMLEAQAVLESYVVSKSVETLKAIVAENARHSEYSSGLPYRHELYPERKFRHDQ